MQDDGSSDLLVQQTTNPQNTFFPDGLDGLIARARQATQRSDWSEACEYWASVRMLFPANQQGYHDGALALQNAGRIEEAEAVLEEAIERFPKSAQIAIAHARVVSSQQDWTRAICCWQVVCRRFPTDPWGYLGNIKALRSAGRNDEITPLLAAIDPAIGVAKRQGLSRSAVLWLELELAEIRSDWSAVRQAARRIIDQDPTRDAHVFRRLANACWHLAEYDAADQAALGALAIDPQLVDALLVRTWVATEAGDAELMLSCYRRLAELRPNTVRYSINIIQILNWLGRIEDAITQRDILRARWPDDRSVNRFLAELGIDDPSGQVTDPSAMDDNWRRLVSKSPDASLRRRNLIDNRPEWDCLVAEVPGADTALLVFSGTNDRVSFPLSIFDLFLATFDCTVIYLKDFNRLHHLAGVKSLAADYAGTLIALQNLLVQIGTKRLCTIGNCAGGFAAIRYGVELGADRILAFSPPTHCLEIQKIASDQKYKIFTNRLRANIPPDRLDLKPFLAGQEHESRIELFYEENIEKYRMQALRLSGLAGVTLHPQSGTDKERQLTQFMLQADEPCALLAKYLAIRSMAASGESNSQYRIGALYG